MKNVLERWIDERIQIMVREFPPNVTFEGRLEEVGDEFVTLHQDSGIVSMIRLESIIAAHRIPSVTLARPQLEIVGPRKAN